MSEGETETETERFPIADSLPKRLHQTGVGELKLGVRISILVSQVTGRDSLFWALYWGPDRRESGTRMLP